MADHLEEGQGHSGPDPATRTHLRHRHRPQWEDFRASTVQPDSQVVAPVPTRQRPRGPLRKCLGSSNSDGLYFCFCIHLIMRMFEAYRFESDILRAILYIGFTKVAGGASVVFVRPPWGGWFRASRPTGSPVSFVLDLGFSLPLEPQDQTPSFTCLLLPAVC